MADKKISALTGASTPLAGTEVLPIVQSGATVKVAVSDLTGGLSTIPVTKGGTGTTTAFTAGSVVFAGASGVYSEDNANLFWDDTNNRLGVGTTTPYSKLELYNGIFLPNSGEATGIGSLRITNNQNALSGDGGIEFKGSGDSGGNGSKIQNLNGIGLAFAIRTGSATWTQGLGIGTTADVTVNTGNLVIGTSGKGIDFSATPGTGTSELLADYEEGDWTPTQGAGLVVVGAFSSSGTYTKIGRQVTVRGALTGATSISSLAGNVITAGLPFTPAAPSTHTASNAFAGSASVCLLSGNDIFSISAIANGGGVIYFAMTYFV